MNRARLTFTKAKNSFSVRVENLQRLSIEQIQELERFVANRKGIFDFNSYKFVIQKRLDFEEFVSLLKQCGIKAICKESIVITKNRPRILFGNYKGMFYTDIPDSYLLWLKSNYRGVDRKFIDAELSRRGI